MTHDYQQYESFANDHEEVTLKYRVECEDCGWQNRRSSDRAVRNAKESHENRHPGHSVFIEEDGGPFDDD